jgi:hypothetical protein
MITLPGVAGWWASAISRCRRGCGGSAVPTTPVASVTKTVRFRLAWFPHGTKNVMDSSLAG